MGIDMGTSCKGTFPHNIIENKGDDMGDAYRSAYYSLATQQRSDAGNTPNTSTLPKGFKAVPKFNPGDKVSTPYGDAEILESTGADAWGNFEYLLRSAEGAEYYDYEMNLNNDEQVPAISPGCECGAAKVYGKGTANWMHSDWCPKFRSGV